MKNIKKELPDSEFESPLKRWLTTAIFLVSSISFSFVLGYRLGNGTYWIPDSNMRQIQNKLNAQNTKNIDFNLLWKTWNIMENRYVDRDKLDRQKMYYGMIKGMVASAEDPYTFFLTPEENRQSKEDLNGKFEGIGAQLDLLDGMVHVVAPLPGSPAEEAGLKSGDIIVKVDNEEIRNLSLQQVVSKIKGPKGTKVRLGIYRDKGEELNIDIIRDRIIVKSVESKIDSKEGYAYIKINKFGDTTNQEWDKAVAEVVKSRDKVKGLILDLRNNPGGYLDGAIYITSEFLKKNEFILRQESSTISRNYLAERDGNLVDIPLVILVNRGSASASEIVSGALRDHKKAVLVGEKTFGKGSVQEVVDLDGGFGLHVTIAKWVLPGGDWINKKGIKPKFEVKSSESNKDKQDKQLEKAIEVLKEL